MPATWRLIQGDCLQRLAELPAGSVQCVVTSPPYFALRSYLPSAHPDKAREIGSEPTPEAFVATMVAVFREVRRVLRDDGLCFVNLGDSYNQFNANRGEAAGLTDAGQKCGDILNIPHRVAIAMHADGWYWRQTIVWRKPAPMPESIGGWRWERCRIKLASGDCSRMGERTGSGFDPRETPLAKWRGCPGCKKCTPNGGLVLRRGRGRCTTAHEYIFLFSKGEQYFWDEAAKEDAIGNAPNNRGGGKDAGSETQARLLSGRLTTMNVAVERRNPRSVWTMATEPFKGKHFACVDEQTECLTATGWKKYDQIAVGEIAAQFNMSTGRLSWGPVLGVSATAVVDQDMIVGHSRDKDFWLTPDHRCVVLKRDSQRGGRFGPSIIRADQLKPTHVIPTAAEWDDAGSGPGLDWAELCGWYIAEGHAKKRAMGVEIYQSRTANLDFCERIERLLVSVQAEYERVDYQRQWRGRQSVGSAFHIHGFAAAKLRSLCPDKAMPSTCLTWSNKECHALLAGLVMGDGTYRECGRSSFNQKRSDVADMAQALAVRCGAPCSMAHAHGGMIWRLYMAARSNRSLRGTNGKGGGCVHQKYTGVVWCPTTELGTWVARRNGRVWITGNSFPSSLPKKCIELATSAGGCCPKCGACWAPIIEKKRVATRPGGASKVYGIGDMVLDPSSPYWDHNGTIAGNRDPDRHIQVARVHGYRPTCGCGDVGHAVPCVVLDPFAGTGQTLRAAHWLGRSGVGIDLNQEYLDMAAERIMVPPKWTQPVKAVRVRRVTEDCPLFVEANQ